ncbi:MAG TPA: NAD(P)-binding domain-containing protein [Pseudonocardiaceae bacterium]
MKIGIIGAGMIGGTLTRRLCSLGHAVQVANSRSPQTLADLAGETGATAVWAAQAADDTDLVIVTIPQKSVPDLAPGILGGARPGAPVIDTNNYYPQRDGHIAGIEAGTPESVWVAEQLGAPVVKVFNTIWYKRLLNNGKPKGAAGRIALPVAGAAGPGKQQVFNLVEELGFDPVDGGTLADSWRQQPGTPAYAKDFGIEETLIALAEARPGRAKEFRA